MFRCKLRPFGTSSFHFSSFFLFYFNPPPFLFFFLFFLSSSFSCFLCHSDGNKRKNLPENETFVGNHNATHNTIRPWTFGARLVSFIFLHAQVIDKNCLSLTKKNVKITVIAIPKFSRRLLRQRVLINQTCDIAR